MRPGRARALFLDRDGTVIEDVGYARDPADVRFLPGALDALNALQAAGWALVVISNQSGIGRGLITEAEADAVHARLVERLAQSGVALAAHRYCPHAPDAGCDCRKPSPKLILEVAHHLGLDLPGSFTIGDKASDTEAGRRAGTRTIRFDPDRSAGGETATRMQNWGEVVAMLTDEPGGGAMQLADLAGTTVLSVGDVMLDEYVWGDVRRISPEAPVPIVEIRGRTHSPGGAANVAAGVTALGGHAYIAGVVGEDDAADALRATLTEANVATEDLVTDSTRPTTTKTRVIAQGQQVMRTDHEDRSPVSPATEAELIERVRGRVAAVDAVVVSDYRKGVITHGLSRAVIEAASIAGTPVIADPKGLDYSYYRGATVITPNVHDAGLTANIQVDSEDDLVEVARRLSEACAGSALLITRGAQGMSLFDGDGRFDVPTRARDIYDVTGAGDTVVAMLAVALGRGVPLAEAVTMANAAAGVVVGRVGTSTVSLAEVQKSLNHH